MRRADGRINRTMLSDRLLNVLSIRIHVHVNMLTLMLIQCSMPMRALQRLTKAKMHASADLRSAMYDDVIGLTNCAPRLSYRSLAKSGKRTCLVIIPSKPIFFPRTACLHHAPACADMDWDATKLVGVPVAAMTSSRAGTSCGRPVHQTPSGKDAVNWSRAPDSWETRRKNSRRCAAAWCNDRTRPDMMLLPCGCWVHSFHVGDATAPWCPTWICPNYDCMMPVRDTPLLVRTDRGLYVYRHPDEAV